VNNSIVVLGYSKLPACLVPRSLTDYCKTVWKEVCLDLHACYPMCCTFI